MYRIAICEDEKVILDFESSLINEWAKGPLCQGDYQLESYPSAENFLFESPDKAPYDLLIFDRGISSLIEKGKSQFGRVDIHIFKK